MDKKTRVFDLATKLVEDTRCLVTVPLCGKIAILRAVYTEHPGANFWDKVDSRLEMMRSRAEGDQVKVVRAIKGYLKKDKTIYGGGLHTKVAPEELNPWQQGVDDSLVEAAVAAAAATED
ncbi:hypothetical protein B0H34DRAFT_793181 [Crassisporium funariophilum]|nr:hypothetical protein B0H34DRAFT_793181 [Crassisporium funariophilum]